MRRPIKAMADVMSSILNWVCPDCGGRMGGFGKEFKCQGQCQMDWRQVWDGLFSWGVGANQRKATRAS
jgi:hypothetical protein